MLHVSPSTPSIAPDFEFTFSMSSYGQVCEKEKGCVLHTVTSGWALGKNFFSDGGQALEWPAQGGDGVAVPGSVQVWVRSYEIWFSGLW